MERARHELDLRLSREIAETLLSQATSSASFPVPGSVPGPGPTSPAVLRLPPGMGPFGGSPGLGRTETGLRFPGWGAARPASLVELEGSPVPSSGVSASSHARARSLAITWPGSRLQPHPPFP